VLPCPREQITPMSRKTKSSTATAVHNKPEAKDARKPPAAMQAISTVATLKDLRKATQHTQDDLAAAMGMGQGTVSRIEKRHDMLVSTLQHYVEGVGGSLQILVTFPD